jgi:hypothetical protein
VAALSRVGGSGTTNRVPKFTASSTLGNSQIFDNGTDIGIGTITPQGYSGYKGVTIDSSSGSFIQFRRGGINRLIIASTPNESYFFEAANLPIYFATNNAERFRVAANGNFLVGTSTDNGEKFQVDGTGRIASSTYLATGAVANVGIGTTSPRSLTNQRGLTIDGTSSFVQLRQSGNEAFQFGSDSIQTFLYEFRNAPIVLSTNQTERMRITSSGESLFGTTTDNGDFRVQVNGNQYVSGNVGIGNISPGFKLDVTGGIRASENSRINQAQIGLGANNSTTSVAFGVNALVSATTGESGNTAIGRETLRLLTTGTNNVAVGWNSGQSLVTGSFNTFVGLQAGNSTTTGGTNTFIGYLAGRDNVLGSGNTYIGNNAGILQSRGNNNVIIGGTFGNTDSTNNNIWIANGSGNVRIRVDSAGNTGIGQAVPTERLHVNGRARVTTIDSSASPINMLWADVDGVVRKAPVPTASVSGGTTDFIPLWSSSTALTSSVIKQVSSEILVGYTTDQGTFKLQVDGNTFTNGSIKTAAPSGGTAAEWKLGIVVAGSYTAASNYLQVDVGGTLYYIGLVTPN